MDVGKYGGPFFVQDVIKDMHELLGEQVRGVRSGGVPSAGARVPGEWRYVPLRHMDVFTNLEPHWTPSFWVSGRLQSHKHD